MTAPTALDALAERDGDERVAFVTGVEGMALHAMLAGLGALGIMPLVLSDHDDRPPSLDPFERRYSPMQHDLVDRLDSLSLILGDHPEPRKPSRVPLWPRQDAVTHVNTPKPISKRRARRLRGRTVACARTQETTDVP